MQAATALRHHFRDRGTYKVWEEGKAPDFVLEVASPSTAENDALYKAAEYAGIGVREYWRLDPKGSLMERPLEGYEVRGGRYKRVAAVRRKGRGPHLRSEVLDLDLRSRRRDGATVLVFRDPRTGESSTAPWRQPSSVGGLRRIGRVPRRNECGHWRNDSGTSRPIALRRSAIPRGEYPFAPHSPPSAVRTSRPLAAN